MLFIHILLSFVTHLTAKNGANMKITNNFNYLIIIFHVSKAQKNKFCKEIKDLKFYINL